MSKVFSNLEEYLLKKKSVHGRIVLLTFFRNGRSRKIVKLRILRIQSVESFGNPNLLIVEFRWKLIFLKLVFSDWHLLKLFSFFRLASVKAVFFFPIGIC